MDVGIRAAKGEFNFKDLLQVIAVLMNWPNHTEEALQKLYSGINQDHGESVTVYLERELAVLTIWKCIL